MIMFHVNLFSGVTKRNVVTYIVKSTNHFTIQKPCSTDIAPTHPGQILVETFQGDYAPNHLPFIHITAEEKWWNMNI